MPSLRLYLDECIHLSIIPTLESTGCDVLVAVKERAAALSDVAQLLRATTLQRVLLTHNQLHFRRLHRAFTAQGKLHGGIIVLPQTLPFSRLAVRAGLLIEFVSTFWDHTSQLYSWANLQQEIINGYRPRSSRYSEAQMRDAIGWR